MSKFILFAGEDYYPSQGWGNFIRSYASKAEAVAAGWAVLYKEVKTFADEEGDRRGTVIEWWSVVDVEAEKPVESSWDEANYGRAKQIEDEYREPFKRENAAQHAAYVAAGGVEIATTSVHWSP